MYICILIIIATVHPVINKSLLLNLDTRIITIINFHNLVVSQSELFITILGFYFFSKLLYIM